MGDSFLADIAWSQSVSDTADYPVPRCIIFLEKSAYAILPDPKLLGAVLGDWNHSTTVFP